MKEDGQAHALAIGVHRDIVRIHTPAPLINRGQFEPLGAVYLMLIPKLLQGVHILGVDGSEIDILFRAVSYTHLDVYKRQRYPHSGKEDLARMIRDYLKAHFTEDVTLSAISEQFSLSPPYIVTLFKKQYGTTVVEYLTDLRIDYACEALKNSAVAAAEIGSAVG